SKLPGDLQEEARFGIGDLAAGRIGDDKYDDLAIGTSDYRVGGAHDVGQVVVVHGGPNGLDPTRAKGLVPGTGGVPGPATENANFGCSLSIGETNGDHRGDLAVGSCSSDAKPVQVLLFLGAAKTVTTSNVKALSEKTLGEPVSGGDGFGE